MKKSSILILFFFIGLIASAQPDLSGSWKINKESSKLNDQFSMAPEKIIINLNGNDLSIERHSNFQGNEFKTTDKLTLDGKECKNAGFMDTEKKSVVSLSDDKKAITVKSKIPMQDGGEMSIKEVYSIENGKLKLESSNSSSFGDMSETMVFDKQ